MTEDRYVDVSLKACTGWQGRKGIKFFEESYCFLWW